MIAYQPLYDALGEAGQSLLAEALPAIVHAALHDRRHGKMAEWLSWLEQLPALTAASVDLSVPTIVIGSDSEISARERQQLENVLRRFHPWRKGPFSVFGIHIDTEWRSDWKWQRLAAHITALDGRLVLDVGCGSGYHALRMAGAGARRVMGIDPTMLYVMQFQALKHFIPHVPVDVLPLQNTDLPAGSEAFDTVFSMGVLYHCRSPLDHLLELKGHLRDDGELVLETLYADGEDGYALVPQQRYAKMRNVWFIPGLLTLESWLRRCDFNDIEVINVTQTSTDEQRATDWMTFESLADFLDPQDAKKTIEGYPAPARVIVRARKR